MSALALMKSENLHFQVDAYRTTAQNGCNSASNLAKAEFNRVEDGFLGGDWRSITALLRLGRFRVGASDGPHQ
jgi:hypothetical protein